MPAPLRTLALLVGLSLIVPSVTGAASGRERPLAIIGATLHRVSGSDIERGVLVIGTDGLIAAVGSAAEVSIPDEAERVDGDGLHVYPGFINANSVLGLIEISSVRGTVDVAEAGTLNPTARAELAVNPASELIPVTRANGVLLALTAGRGGMIAGTSALIALDGWTWEEMTIRAPVAMHIQWPGMGIDRRPEAKKTVEEQIEAREKTLRELRDLFAQAAAYWQARRAEGAKGVPRHDADVAWEAMRPVIDHEIPLVIEANDVAQIRAALDWTAAEGLDMILAGGRDAWMVADELGRRRIPVIVNTVNALPARKYEPYDTPYTNAAKLAAAGVSVLFSTDPGGFGAANARNLPYEAAKAVAFGLPRAAAIRGLTLGAAQAFGVADRLGSLDQGKEATLILVAGDPLEAEAEVRGAWIAGREVDLGNRHRRLYEKYNARPRPAATAPAAPR